MSVGGKVIEVVELEPNKVWVNTRERYWSGKIGKFKDGEECAIYCDPLGNKIRVGDSLWWQSSTAYWTPYRDGKAVEPADRRLKKIGFSGVTKP